MENQSSNPPNAGPIPAAQQQNLIRTDQVSKLPHLNDAQKGANTQVVRNLWDILNSHSQGSPEYNSAHAKLANLSQSLMRGMKSYQYSRAQQLQLQQQQKQMQQMQQQGQQQRPPQQGQQGDGPQPNQPAQPRPQMGQPQTFQQLLPQIQAKVNTLSFVYPPRIDKAQVDGWLAEAKLRYGIALQKQELGKVKLSELRQAYTQRQSAGNLTPEEMQDFKNRQVAANKLLQEGSDFLTKFKEQQESFRTGQTQQVQQQQPNQQTKPGVFNQGQIPAAPQPSQGPVVKTEPSLADGSRPATQIPTSAPAPHTITSAVAARNQAGQAAMSSSTAAPVSTQTPTQHAMHVSQAQIPQQAPQSTTVQNPPSQPQQPFPPQTSQPDSTNTPTTAAPTQTHPPGPPRPLSQQAAFQQSAQTYSNNNSSQQQQQSQQGGAMGAPQQQQQQVQSSHAHPQGYANNRSDSSTRSVHMAIPKQLNVKPPEPVTMGAARPTLSGGPSHGAMGMMGQPAIQKHPGYVLEGEGQHVLSKKMLDVLVKQVTGGGEGQGLTPDAEEFILQMADDFVDDVITAACRLAKLRPASTLDIRDIQLVLERNYNMRIPGFSSDDLRTVKKPHPTQGWTQKMSAIQAAKVTQGRAE
ncbi:hypothetical protein AJ79_08202 [Helicocarpus griseus UAMH5409]|uniref:Transcription initiation factor TFIID subunit 12 domain-containing protein n=1 Tax=Helicocarpus griseus UAMH5409 TaxID=1447875 RepID=A0A2B7WV17_9EURO|nr:hypothetical protein AJ79_08202 [Helicocarpus griseus UAMH5409]